MNKPVITIEAPKINDESVANIRAFLQEVTYAFESHYRERLIKYYCRISEFDDLDKKFNDD